MEKSFAGARQQSGDEAGGRFGEIISVERMHRELETLEHGLTVLCRIASGKEERQRVADDLRRLAEVAVGQACVAVGKRLEAVRNIPPRKQMLPFRLRAARENALQQFLPPDGNQQPVICQDT